MRTVIHEYHFDTADGQQAAAYRALKAQLEADGLECFASWGGNGKGHWQPELDGRTLDLEEGFLFSNQWNTGPVEGTSALGLRVFDWAEDYPINFSALIKRGHYLTQTPEMQAVRTNRLKCGYCGFQVERKQSPLDGFCPQCLGSEYLKETDLPLTRLRGVMDSWKNVPLTSEQSADRLPKYRDAQLYGHTERDKRRLAKQRHDLKHKYERGSINVEREYKGMIWLLDHGLKIENAIYYDHTDRFSFGWRKALSEGEVSALVDVLVEFPFDYDLKKV